MKLENKLKNRQMKQQNTAKKHRKEQKKLRLAIKDNVLSGPRPLETYKKRPGERTDTKSLLCNEPNLQDQVFVVLCSSMSKLICDLYLLLHFTTHNALPVCVVDRGGGG